MHASKDSRAALRCAGCICRGALSLSFFPSVYFLSLFHRGAGGSFTTLSSRLASSSLSCTAPHCTALRCTISNPLPSLLTPLTPHHTTPYHGKRSTVLLCMQYHRNVPRRSRLHMHMHTHTQMQMQACNAALPNTVALASGRASASASALGEVSVEVSGRLSSLKL
jgi:hypothetical protein